MVLLNNLEKVFGFAPPRKNGFDTVEAIKVMSEKEAKVFAAMGGDFLSATLNNKFTVKTLQNCDLTVQISTKLNRSHLIHGKTALILPTLCRTDTDLQADGEIEEFTMSVESL